MNTSEHRARARAALRGNWVTAVLVFLVAGILGGSDSSGFELNLKLEGGQVEFSMPQQLQQFLEGTLGLAIPVIITVGLVLLVLRLALSGVMNMGTARYGMNLIDGREARFEDLFSGFSRFYDALIMNIVSIAAVFLGMLLFVIPGLILSYAYAMAPYILAENPDISGTDALRLSRQMMQGHKWELFCLDFSFIGWNILASITLGIGFLFLNPYMGISNASFYRNLQQQNRWNTPEQF